MVLELDLKVQLLNLIRGGTMKSKGFTLIELAVVLAIIAILAAILTPMVTGYLDPARVARAQADARTIAGAVKLYQRDTGRWPVYASAGDFSSNTILQPILKTITMLTNAHSLHYTGKYGKNGPSSLTEVGLERVWKPHQDGGY